MLKHVQNTQEYFLYVGYIFAHLVVLKNRDIYLLKRAETMLVLFKQKTKTEGKLCFQCLRNALCSLLE